MTAVALKRAAIPYAAKLAVLALVYFTAAKASLVFAIPPGYATAVWLPSGIAVAAIVLWGLRCWPGIWLGAALANFTIGLSMPAALGIATGNTLEALCAGWLAAGLVDRDAGFRRPEAVFQFAVVAAAASTLAATAGVGVLTLIGAVPDGEFLANWYTWWQGDATGILVVTPCVVAWARAGRTLEPPLPAPELTLFGALFAAALIAVFAQSPANESLRPVAFLTMPFFAWAACRFDERTITSCVLAATAFAVWCTVNGRGPFAGAQLNESLLTLQAFTSTAALVALALGALTRERERALRTLRASNDALDDAVRVQGDALGARDHEIAQVQALAHVGRWDWDSRSGRMTWSDELCRICGIEPGGFEGNFEAYLARVDARDRERMRSLLRGALFECRPWEAMQRIVRDDGVVRVLHSFGHATARAHGAPTRMQGICVDVTERVRLSESEARLRSLSQRLLDAQEAERGQVAAELREGVARPLAAVHTEVGLARLAAPLAAVREVIAQLRPASLEDYGLLAALHTHAARFERRTGIPVAVVGADDTVPIAPRLESALFQIARDALDNVARHSGARSATVEFDVHGGVATLSIRDDGCGFDAQAARPRDAWGLALMRERAEAIGGQLRVESAPGSGTRVSVRLRC